MKKVFLLLLSILITQNFFSQHLNLAEQLAEDQNLIRSIEEFDVKKLRILWSENDSIVFMIFYSKVMEEQMLYYRIRMYSNLKEKQRKKINTQILKDRGRYFILLSELKELRSRFQIIQDKYFRLFVYN